MKRFLPLLLIIILTIPTFWRLLRPGYFSMHDDLQVMRIYEIEKCFADGQIPCRWSPDMSFGYGQPMFNFYSTFPYFLGTFIRMISPLSIMATVRALFLIGLLGGAFSMYFLGRRFWGETGGVVSSIAYTYAPYHALDLYVRGALSEIFALAVLPLIFLFTYLVINIKKSSVKNICFLALSLFVLFTSHNISSLIYAPFVLFWSIFWIIHSKKWKSIISLTTSLILGLGLSAFFLLPNIAEQTLIRKESLVSDYYFYPSHFVSLKQLFLERDWGFGPSTFGPNDEMSFQIGWPHWLLGVILGIFGLLKLKSNPKTKSILLLGLLVLSGFSAFLTHQRSFFIWEAIPILSYVQFPWRFLGLTILFVSLAIGAIVTIPKLVRWPAFILVVTLLIALNYPFFKPEHYWWWANDQEKLSGVQFELQQKAAILDYLPKSAEEAPRNKAPENPEIVSGKGLVSNFSKRSNSFFFDAEIFEDAAVQIPITFFPGWEVIKEGKAIPSYPSGKLGLISINLPQGKHIIGGRFRNTPVRFAGNAITVFSFLFLFSILILSENDKRFFKFKI